MGFAETDRHGKEAVLRCRAPQAEARTAAKRSCMARPTSPWKGTGSSDSHGVGAYSVSVETQLLRTTRLNGSMETRRGDRYANGHPVLHW